MAEVKRGWVLVAAIVGAAAALGTAVWTGIQINEWYNRPQANLTALLEFGRIVTSSASEKQSEALDKLTDPDWLRGLKITLYDEQTVRDAIRAIAPRPASPPRGYILITLTNEGSETASNVRLTVPDATELRFDAEGEKSKTFSGPTLALGTLPALESINIIAFTQFEPSGHTASKIRLTHSGGLGKVVLKELDRPYTAPSLWATFRWPLLVLVGLFVLGFLGDGIFKLGRLEGAREERAKVTEGKVPEGKRGD